MKLGLQLRNVEAGFNPWAVSFLQALPGLFTFADIGPAHDPMEDRAKILEVATLQETVFYRRQEGVGWREKFVVYSGNKFYVYDYFKAANQELTFEVAGSEISYLMDSVQGLHILRFYRGAEKVFLAWRLKAEGMGWLDAVIKENPHIMDPPKPSSKKIEIMLYETNIFLYDDLLKEIVLIELRDNHVLIEMGSKFAGGSRVDRSTFGDLQVAEKQNFTSYKEIKLNLGSVHVLSRMKALQGKGCRTIIWIGGTQRPKLCGSDRHWIKDSQVSESTGETTIYDQWTIASPGQGSVNGRDSKASCRLDEGDFDSRSGRNSHEHRAKNASDHVSRGYSRRNGQPERRNLPEVQEKLKDPNLRNTYVDRYLQDENSESSLRGGRSRSGHSRPADPRKSNTSNKSPSRLDFYRDTKSQESHKSHRGSAQTQSQLPMGPAGMVLFLDLVEEEIFDDVLRTKSHRSSKEIEMRVRNFTLFYEDHILIQIFNLTQVFLLGLQKKDSAQPQTPTPTPPEPAQTYPNQPPPKLQFSDQTRPTIKVKLQFDRIGIILKQNLAIMFDIIVKDLVLKFNMYPYKKVINVYMKGFAIREFTGWPFTKRIDILHNYDDKANMKGRKIISVVGTSRGGPLVNTYQNQPTESEEDIGMMCRYTDTGVNMTNLHNIENTINSVREKIQMRRTLHPGGDHDCEPQEKFQGDSYGRELEKYAITVAVQLNSAENIGKDRIGTNAEVLMNNANVKFLMQPTMRLLDVILQGVLGMVGEITKPAPDSNPIKTPPRPPSELIQDVVKRVTNPVRLVYGIKLNNTRVMLAPNLDCTDKKLTLKIPEIMVWNEEYLDNSRLTGENRNLYGEKIIVQLTKTHMVGVDKKLNLFTIPQAKITIDKLKFPQEYERILGKEIWESKVYQGMKISIG